MKKLLFVAALAAFALGAARPASATTMTSCPLGTVVANVTLTISGQPEIGIEGNIWATSNSSMQVVVIKLGANRYCVMSRETGTLTTVAGDSPGGTGTVTPGVLGYLTRTQAFFATGTWNPRAATSGYVGSFSGQFNPVSLFVSDATDSSLTWYVGLFSAPLHGCWTYRLDLGSIGDIL
jgi:hypothetical protein